MRPTLKILLTGMILAAAMVLLASSQGLAQSVVQAPATDLLLDQAYHSMYNLNFQAAFEKAEQAKAGAANDPLPWMAQACAALFQEFDRLHILRSELFSSDDTFDARPAHNWNDASRRQFEAALSRTEQLAEQRLAHNKSDERALFSLVIVNGLRADDAALISKKNMAALSYTKKSNAYAEQLLAHSPGYYDAYVATGMGKYIVGGKAAPVRWLLRIGGVKGDRAEGVRELTLAAQHGHYLAPFARILLAFEDLRRKDKAAARAKLAELHSQYPNNPLFTQELAKLDSTSVGPGQ